MQLQGGVARQRDVDVERRLGAAIDDLQLVDPVPALFEVLQVEVDDLAGSRLRWQPAAEGQSLARRRRCCEVAGRVPVRALEVYLATRRCEAVGKLLTVGEIVGEPNGVPSRYITERADLTDLDEHRAARVAAECHASLEEHIRARLGCGLRLRIAVTVAVLRLKIG